MSRMLAARPPASVFALVGRIRLAYPISESGEPALRVRSSAGMDAKDRRTSRPDAKQKHPLLSRTRRNAGHISLPEIEGGQYHTVVHSDATMKATDDGRGEGEKAVTLYYHADPPEQGKERVLLIHGTGANLDCWTWSNKERKGCPAKPVLERLHDAGYLVTRADLRGHGRSSEPDGPYSVALLAADMAELVKAIHPGEKVHVCGHSVGFGIATALVCDYPELALSLAGSGFKSNMRMPSLYGFIVLALMLQFREVFTFILAWIFSRRSVNRLFERHLRSGLVINALLKEPKEFSKDFMIHTPWGGFCETAMAWQGFDYSHKLTSIQVPALYIYPDYDRYGPVTETEFVADATKVKDSKVVIFGSDAEGKHYTHCFMFIEEGAGLYTDALIKHLKATAECSAVPPSNLP